MGIDLAATKGGTGQARAGHGPGDVLRWGRGRYSRACMQRSPGRRAFPVFFLGAVVAAVAGAGGLGLSVSCGTDGSTFGDGPCSTVYEGQCGKACAGDSDCPNGLYCGAGQCRADCVSGDQLCTAPATCDARGRCGPGSIGFGDGGGPGGDNGGGDACIDLNVDLSKIKPTVVLLVDESSSMSASFGPSGSRWSVVQDVLLDCGSGIVKRLEGEVTFGLELYTRGGPSPQPTPKCPRLIGVAPAPNTYDQMVSAYIDSGGPGDGTPTGEAIDKVIGRVNGVIVDGGLATLSTPGPKIIVLATDGEPDICADGNDEDAGRKVSLAAAQAAFDAGIRTYVIGVGDQIGATRLREMANAGAGQPIDTGDAAPFSALDPAQFVAAMNAITFSIRSCSFALNGTVEPGQETSGTVTLDGKPLTFDDPNGWILSSHSQLEVLGTACDAIKNTGGRLAVRFPCGAFAETPTK